MGDCLKKKYRWIAILLLALLLLLGSCAAFRAYAEYAWANLFRTTVTRLDSLTEEQTELLAEHFGLRGEDLEVVTGYYASHAPQVGDSFVIFTARVDPTRISELVESEEQISYYVKSEAAEGRLLNDDIIHYDEEIRLSGSLWIYRLSDGSGYTFLASNVPHSLLFRDAESHE